MNGYIICKTEGGGVIQWVSHHITLEEAIETMGSMDNTAHHIDDEEVLFIIETRAFIQRID